MKLAMRLPEKSAGHANDADPRDDETTEVIDLASRTSYPAVANRKSNKDALGLLAGVGFVALLGAATFWGLNSTGSDDGEAATADVAAPPPAPMDYAASPADGLPSANAGAVPMEDPAPAPVLARAPEGENALGPAGNPYSSPTLVFDGGTAPATAAANAAAAEAAALATPEGAVAPGGGAAGEFAARIGGVGGGPAMATQDVNPATTVTQGTMIPAILETAINTDVPGFVRAVVSQDVRSFDGSRVLIPRSSRLVGQYQSGLQAGQRRAYVIWQRVIRPDGVTVSLQSPATSFDGTAGLEGEVNTHFFSRFGSAMLLSVIGGLTTIAGGGASVILGGGQSAANTALQQDGQRSPTVRVRMGEPIRVYTARDLDFSQAPKVN
ncbi:TrbI/VirB10 family protein [Aurantiacibacter poecillastricola]|uniref:TrbI/VirB10 family protein n=1 Tax=Aurantiacibacter poecillastricola TaxID=3064385 RepID=UPI00273D8263|nr:TrbI/VirB10 family protein [Aurantiacibacter sp. 219JJ12-13]MDP5260045.1 TrbI/VirB10 family protein [Aurantiacibacter sp. 219JJ12-13]